MSADTSIIIGNVDSVEVDCSLSVREGGKDRQVNFSVNFERMTRPEAIALSERLLKSIDRRVEIAALLRAGCDDAEELEAEAKELSRLQEVEIRARMVGWTLQGNGAKVPFEEEYIDAVLDHAAYFDEIATGLFAATGKCRDRNVKN